MINSEGAPLALCCPSLYLQIRHKHRIAKSLLPSIKLPFERDFKEIDFVYWLIWSFPSVGIYASYCLFQKQLSSYLLQLHLGQYSFFKRHARLFYLSVALPDCQRSETGSK